MINGYWLRKWSRLVWELVLSSVVGGALWYVYITNTPLAISYKFSLFPQILSSVIYFWPLVLAMLAAVAASSLVLIVLYKARGSYLQSIMVLTVFWTVVGLMVLWVVAYMNSTNAHSFALVVYAPATVVIAHCFTICWERMNLR